MQHGAVSHAFDRFDLLVLSVEAQHQTRKNRAPVDQHRARAALAELAAVLGAHQIQIFTQDFQQRLVRREGNFRCLAVQREPYLRLLLV